MDREIVAMTILPTTIIVEARHQPGRGWFVTQIEKDATGAELHREEAAAGRFMDLDAAHNWFMTSKKIDGWRRAGIDVRFQSLEKQTTEAVV